MRSLKTAVKIWKKEIEFKFTTWGISREYRANYRRMRREAYRNTKKHMAADLLSRHEIGDIILDREDFSKIQRLSHLPVFLVVEEIYKKYL